ncbi:putative serine/threonine-protein kinase DDB_G0284251 [Rhizoctonia solani AG-1 IB]|uniref:Putative serine/threonine-protein kinase DDB_G0284251 n=1 Tax=Thanatephorus cucumeris (strain AG1-IB / isolate 7/3/14) TaxID=1108050 RepID=M5CBK9_THACB|nr:putative serine/threonine-protein kinase DDB_G0284251 [Rhizoctonia solani AG-1 IB]
MAYSGYQNGPAYVEDSRFPAGPSNKWHYGTPQSYGPMPISQGSPLEPPGSPWRVGVNSTAPSTGFMPPGYGSGPAPGQTQQNMHVVTNHFSDNHNNIWPGGSGGDFVQSPSSYCSPPPPPNPQGVPSTPWCKIIDIKLEKGNYVPIDLTRCLDGREIRQFIISMLLDVKDPPVSRFHIFHDSPSGPELGVPLGDQQLMLEVTHFGNAERSLKLSVKEVTSNPYPQSYTRIPTTTPLPVPPHLHNSYYTQTLTSPSESPSRSTFGYYSSPPPIHMPIHMSMPMPVSVSVPDNGRGCRTAPEFPVPNVSPAFPTASASPDPRGPTVRQPSYARPPESPVTINSVPINNYLGQGLSGSGNTGLDENGGKAKFGDHWYNTSTSTSSEGSRSGSVVINGTMTTEEILSHLYARGCQNLTGKLDESTFNKDPVESGGAGDVYSGNLYTGQRVGVKCIRMTNKDMCDEEQSKLKYRNRIAMVSPWMENGDLRRFLRSYPQTDRYDLCVQMANGVAYLHSKKIVHGDIKGAPEIIEDKSVNSYAADVYALGMTMLEAMTGKMPYVETANDVAAMQKITKGIHPPRPNTHIPESCRRASFLWSLLEACWDLDPQRRPTAARILDQVRTIKY